MNPILFGLLAAGGVYLGTKLFASQEEEITVPASPFHPDCTPISRAALMRAVDEIAMPIFVPQMESFYAIREDTLASRELFKATWTQVTVLSLQYIDKQMGGVLAKECPHGSPGIMEFAGLVGCEMMRRLVDKQYIDEEPADVEKLCEDPEALAKKLGGLEGGEGISLRSWKTKVLHR